MSLPFFSVVVPTYNRPQQLKRCLEALTHLEYPAERSEIIIVDDGSQSVMDSVVQPFQAVANVVLVRQDNAGPAAARNTGVYRAKGEFVAFTDDDCMPEPNWLSEFAKALQQCPDAMVGGHTINALPQNLYSSASQALIDYLYGYYGSASQGIFFASNNIAMSRSHLLNIGGFDIAFPLAAAEDRNLCDCWQQAGYRMQYVPSAMIRHAHALSLKSFWRQHFGYGRGAFCFHQVRAERTEGAIKVEPFKFYRDLLLYPLKQDRLRSPMQVSVLFFLSQLATAAGFFWERWQGQVTVKI
ncbi:MAG: glycosyltransferase [Cyanobacteria bacterium P01_C01_bin.121]